MMRKGFSMLVLIFLITLTLMSGLFLLSKKDHKNKSSNTSKDIRNKIQLFVAKSDGQNRSSAYLYNIETEDLEQRRIDLKNTGWGVSLLDDRFHSTTGTESIHYDPQTQEIIIIVRITPGGIGGWKPENSLPEPSYKYAVYKTKFDQKAPLELIKDFSSTESSLRFIDHDPEKNLLYLLFYDYENFESKFNKFIQVNTDNGSIKELRFENSPNFDLSRGDISDIRLSLDGNKIYQLGVDSDNLILVSYDLYTTTSHQTVIDSGDHMNYSFQITGLSSEADMVAYYKSNQLNWMDLKNKITFKVPFKERIGNYGVYTSPDGQYLYYGLKSGWYKYHTESDTIEEKIYGKPILWFPNDSSVHLSDGEIIIHHNDKVLRTGIKADSTNDLQVVQWR